MVGWQTKGHYSSEAVACCVGKLCFYSFMPFNIYTKLSWVCNRIRSEYLLVFKLPFISRFQCDERLMKGNVTLKT